MELTKAIYERRSIRKYQNAEITREEIEELIKAAQMAPSWKNFSLLTPRNTRKK